MGLLSTGRSWLQTTMASEGVDISYLRTGSDTLSIVANPDGANETGLGPQGQLVTFGDMDWCFALADLADLSPALPARGDEIRATFSEVVHKWLVLPSGDGPTFDWLDAGRSRIAVHTIYRGVVS